MTNLNALGYKVLSDEMTSKIFGEIPKISQSLASEVINEMKTLGINFPIDANSVEHEDFPMPKLVGKTISEHFSKLSIKMCSDFLPDIQKFISESVSFPPEMLTTGFDVSLFRPFWNKIDYNGDIYPVDLPKERLIIFDCETFVKGTDFGHPIIGSAVTDSGYYLWLHPDLLTNSDSYTPMFISLGQDKIVVAHNAAFDHARVSESYYINDTNVWIDTMSMHINVSGLASGQRFWFVQDSSEESTPKFSPNWSKFGAMNNLVDCYNFHCLPQTKLEKSAKNERNIFVQASNLKEIFINLPSLLLYALNDVYYTQDLFCNLFPKYIQANPSLSTLFGHTVLMKSFLPLHSQWDDWVFTCEQMWQQSLDSQTELLKDLVLEVLEAYKNDEIDVETDPWLSQLDWEVNSKLTKSGKPSSKWYGYPKWVRDVAKLSSNKSLIIDKITTKQRISHLLLRLKWDNQPIVYSKSLGWCFFNEETQQTERIPHPKEQDANVGNLITKDYLSEFESGVISSDLPQARKLLELSISVAYWTSVRSRVKDVIYQNIEGFNAHVPEVVPHNTSTNRAGCNLWFTVPSVKYKKIGSEIKTMCRAPKGYKFVQSDFDSEEIMIASIFADGNHKIAGSTALSHAVLAGNKANGTDMHSVTARQGNITRDVAKNVNYALAE